MITAVGDSGETAINDKIRLPGAPRHGLCSWGHGRAQGDWGAGYCEITGPTGPGMMPGADIMSP